MTTPNPSRPCIVVGFDGSPASRAAVSLAVQRAQPDGERLPPEPFGDSPYGGHYYGPFGPQQGLSVETEPAAWQPPLPPPMRAAPRWQS